MGVVADHEFERGVDLLPRRRVMALDQHDAGALLDHHQRAGEHRGRLVAGRGEHQMDRPLDRGALGDMDQRAVAHQRGVELDHALAIRRGDLAEMLGDHGIAGGQRLGHRTDGQPLREIVEIGQVRREHAVDEHDAPRVHVADQRAGLSWHGSWRHRPARRPAAWHRAAAPGDRCISTPRPAGAASPVRRTAPPRRPAAPRPCGRREAWPWRPHRRRRAPARPRSSRCGVRHS